MQLKKKRYLIIGPKDTVSKDDSHHLKILNAILRSRFTTGSVLGTEISALGRAQFAKNYNKILSHSKYKHLVHRAVKTDYYQTKHFPCLHKQCQVKNAK